MATPEAVKLFEKYRVLSGKELQARYEIYLETYVKNINIEAQACIHMAKKLYIPAVIRNTAALADAVIKLRHAKASSSCQKTLLDKVSKYLIETEKRLRELEAVTEKAHTIARTDARAVAYRDKVVPAMNALRTPVDALEMLLPADLWPVPTYVDMLFKL